MPTNLNLTEGTVYPLLGIYKDIGGSAGDFTFQVQAGGTAVQGVDYTLTIGDFVESNGRPQIGVILTILNDDLVEGPETFNFTAGFVGGSSFDYQVTIAGSDNAIRASLAAGAVPTAGTGTVMVPVTINLDKASATPLQLRLSPLFGTDSSTAVSAQYRTDWNLSGASGTGYSFQAASNTAIVTIPANTTTVTIQIPYFDDNFRHSRGETFRLGLSNANPAAQQDLTVPTAGATLTVTVPHPVSSGGAIVTFAGTAFAGYQTQISADIQAAVAQLSSEIPGGLPAGIRVRVVDDDNLGVATIAAAEATYFQTALISIPGYTLPRVARVPGALYFYKTGERDSLQTSEITLHLDADRVLEFYSGAPDLKSVPAGNTYDAKTIFAHELMHGLGFGTQLQSDSGILSIGTQWNQFVRRLGTFQGSPVIQAGDAGYQMTKTNAQAPVHDHLFDTQSLMNGFYQGQGLTADGALLSAGDLAALQAIGYRTGGQFTVLQGPAITTGGYLLNIMRGGQNDASSQVVSEVVAGRMSAEQARAELVKAADGTTSVATLSYQFFTGSTPSEGGLDYLVNPEGPNPNNINSAYYQFFNLENRYINFAVNLGRDGDGKAAFLAAYGSLSLFEATRTAYAAIFGAAPSDAKLHALLDPIITLGGQTFTRAEYFAVYGGDGPDGMGTKAAMVGFLLAEAEKADLGVLARSNAAYLSDLADGAGFAVNLIGAYSRPEYVFNPG